MESIYERALKANCICENTNSETRYWIDNTNPNDVRYFICNSISTMDNIDEVSEEEFSSRINSTIIKTSK